MLPCAETERIDTKKATIDFQSENVADESLSMDLLPKVFCKVSRIIGLARGA